MNGPAGRRNADEAMSEDEFIANMLKESMGQDEDEVPNIAARRGCERSG